MQTEAFNTLAKKIVLKIYQEWHHYLAMQYFPLTWYNASGLVVSAVDGEDAADLDGGFACGSPFLPGVPVGVEPVTGDLAAAGGDAIQTQHVLILFLGQLEHPECLREGGSSGQRLVLELRRDRSLGCLKTSRTV